MATTEPQFVTDKQGWELLERLKKRDYGTTSEDDLKFGEVPSEIVRHFVPCEINGESWLAVVRVTHYPETRWHASSPSELDEIEFYRWDESKVASHELLVQVGEIMLGVKP